MLIECDVACGIPSIAKHPSVHVVGNVNIFHPVDECLVVVITAPLIAEQQAKTNAAVFAIESEGAVNLRVRVTGNDVVVGGVVVSRRSVLLQEHLTSCGGVDTQRAYCPDGCHRLSFLVADDRLRG